LILATDRFYCWGERTQLFDDKSYTCLPAKEGIQAGLGVLFMWFKKEFLTKSSPSPRFGEHPLSTFWRGGWVVRFASFTELPP
jgi:hypothetical protein